MSNKFEPIESSFAVLQGKVVVLTGGATGIGAATVKLLAENGAAVVFGDNNVTAAKQLESAFDKVTFKECDVTNYDDIYQLFVAAKEKHGRVDHSLSCAGIFEQGNWFDPSLTVESVGEQPGNTKTLDVNVLGSLQFARVAAVFLRDDRQNGEDKSLTLLSSVNAFRESPGLFLYQTSKHAIQGLLRSSRKTLFERDGIRVNAVCPGVVDTPMTVNVIDAFKDNGLWWMSPESVAKIIVGIEATASIHGKAFYIEGGEAWEFEDGFYEKQPQWLGEEPTKRMRLNAEAVNKVSSLFLLPFIANARTGSSFERCTQIELLLQRFV